MKFATLFSGIGAPECAWKSFGWECLFQAEIEKFPSQVLKARFPGVENLGDVTKINEHETFKKSIRELDILVFGSPCQSFSIAGKRLGLDDPRGHLVLHSLKIVDGLKPKWFIFENVPGLLSSDEGRDFGTFLRVVEKIGYSCAWRILDAQFYGVAQQRRRLFLVGYLGDWRPPAAVLFEPESLRGNTPEGRKTGAEIAGCLEARASTGGYDPGAHGASSGHLIVMAHGAGGAEIMENKSPALTCVHDGPPIVANTVTSTYGRNKGIQAGKTPGIVNAIVGNASIRRLTPLECERLQGFPDNWTRIAWRGKSEAECPDGPRYKAIGNSMAVPVLRWIGSRIQIWEDFEKQVNEANAKSEQEYARRLAVNH